MTTPTDGQPPTSTRHVPVMLSRILDLLAPALDGVDGAVHLDGTLGMGGHAEAVLERFGHARVVGIDRDPQAIELASELLARFGDRFVAHHGTYDEVGPALTFEVAQ